MTTETFEKIKHLSRDELLKQLKHFTNGMSVTTDKFEMMIPFCTLEDIEWNHMDQMHRPAIHNTYESGVRIACGKRFAVSLTQWAKWPFLITVTDVYVEKGVFYQSLTIGGIIFVHSIISMVQSGDSIKLTDEWFITSKSIFKPLHWILNRKLHKLNLRLQMEDEQVRQGRYFLRKKGYHFKTDEPDYLNSNLMNHNTVYPMTSGAAVIDLFDVDSAKITKTVNGIDFLLCKEDDAYLIWPAVCPHEGGDLMSGSCHNDQITCPWHGLKFLAARVTVDKPRIQRYGFEYLYADGKIHVIRLENQFNCKQAETESAVG